MYMRGTRSKGLNLGPHAKGEAQPPLELAIHLSLTLAIMD